MTRYLLDTNALIDFSKGREPAMSTILAWIDGSDEVAVCPVSVGEFFSGLTQAEAATWEALTDDFTYLEISRPAAMRAGQDRYTLARVGAHVAITDALLAAVARENNATLVTRNVKHFPMSDLSILALF